MKKIIWVFLMLGLTACLRPVVNLAPKLRPSTLISSSTSEFLIEGQQLFPQSVLIAGQTTQILETDPNGTFIKVKILSALPSGSYTLQVNNASASATSQAGITVLETNDVFANTDYGTLATRNQYILGGRGVLAFKPNANRVAVLAAIANADFSVTQTQEPFVPNSNSVCGQAIVVLSDNKVNRSVIEGLNTLQKSLETLETDVVFDLNAEYVADEPSAGLSQMPLLESVSEVRPAAIPTDLSTARVAVIDSGVSPHPIFAISGGGNFIDTAAARNFTSEGTTTDVSDLATERSADGTPITSSMVGHGTAVAGVIGATILKTFAPMASAYTAQMDKMIVPIKTCEGAAGRCRNSSVVMGVCYAISLNTGSNPVKIINLSLGSKYPSSLLFSALTEASARGMSIITSAGNKGLVVSKPPNFPANHSIAAQGSFEAISGLISVASVEQIPATTVFKASDFSSEASSVSISANGVVQSLAANNLSLSPTALRVFSGTSFSTPQVSAAASLYYAQNAGLAITPETFKQKLLSTAIPSGTANFQSCPSKKCGAGILNMAGILAP